MGRKYAFGSPRHRFTVLYRLVRGAERNTLVEFYDDGWDATQIAHWLMTGKEPDCCAIGGDIGNWLDLAAQYRREGSHFSAKGALVLARSHRLDHGRKLP